MVVNPQTFNYRLIIGTLIVAIIGLGAYSFSSYSKLEGQKDFLSQEKKIVENELSNIVSRYDVLMSENEDFKTELDDAKQRTLKILDSLKYQKVSLSIISKYRKQIQALHLEKGELLKTAKALKTQNSELKRERSFVKNKLVEQTNENSTLTQRNMLLAENIKKGSTLTANSFKADAYKIRSSGKLVTTNKAKRANLIKVCFTLAENALAEAGNKNLYVQILNPNNNIIGDKLTKVFGDYTLIYSTKTSVNYDNDVLDICVKANAGEGIEEFPKGTYFINVFNNEKKLGGTQIVLN